MNKGTLINLVTFAAGAAIGSAATYFVVKKKFEQIANEEIESVKEYFCAMSEDDDEEPKPAVKPVKNITVTTAPAETKDLEEIVQEKVDTILNEVDTIINNQSYSAPHIKEDSNMERPYVIPPEEFGELDDYETVSLTYYADKVLTDDMDELVEDVDDIVGYDSLTRFGEYEDDSVFVRNDRLRCDYEILLDMKTYTEITGNEHPHQMEE